MFVKGWTDEELREVQQRALRNEEDDNLDWITLESWGDIDVWVDKEVEGDDLDGIDWNNWGDIDVVGVDGGNPVPEENLDAAEDELTLSRAQRKLEF